MFEINSCTELIQDTTKLLLVSFNLKCLVISISSDILLKANILFEYILKLKKKKKSLNEKEMILFQLQKSQATYFQIPLHLQVCSLSILNAEGHQLRIRYQNPGFSLTLRSERESINPQCGSINIYFRFVFFLYFFC